MLSSLLPTTMESGQYQDVEEEMRSNYENAIALVGCGPFHWWLLIVCGIANANEAIGIICVSILLPAAECELSLSTSGKGWLNVTMFLGMMVGGYAGGSVCDLYGRRKVLIIYLMMDGSFTLFMSAMMTYFTLLIMIFFKGVGVGGSVPVLWAYFTEFQPKCRRGSALCYLAMYWMFGNIAVAVLAWIIIPNAIVYDQPRLHVQGWRLFILLCSAPSFVVTLALFYMPQSPKFLMMEGKNDEAIKVLKTICKYNQRAKPMPEFHLQKTVTPQKETIQSLKFILHLMMRNTSRLLHFPFRKVFCAIVLVVFSLCFGYYGLWMWLPEMFKRMEHNGGGDVGLCDLKDEEKSQPVQESKPLCTHPMESNIFLDEIIVAVCNAPGHLIAILFMDKLGRKIFLMSGMILSGLSVFAVWLVTTRLSCLLLSALFGMLSALSHSALAVLGMEIFPTDLRGTAWGLSQISARLGAILGNVIFGELVDSRCSVPLLMVAVFLIMGGLFSQVMPDFTQKPLL